MQESAEAGVRRAPDGLERLERWAFTLAAGYFMARLLFYALRIGEGVPPDEETHLGIIGLYSRALLFITDSPESYRFGLVTHKPFLYYFVLGKIQALGGAGVNPVTLLRLVNALLALATVGVGWRLARRVTSSRTARVLFLVMATNIPMSTFLGASVNYDNLVNLLAALGFLALVSFLQEGQAESLLLLLLWISLGVLTKSTFLPLALILVLVVALDRGRWLPGDVRRLVELVTSRRPGWILIAAATALSCFMGVGLYGGNLARFGRLEPQCQSALPLEACLENRIFARNLVVGQFRDGKITLDEAARQAQSIANPGDRDHALRLLQNEAAYERAGRPAPISRWNYWSLAWNEGMRPSIFGIQAHVSLLRSSAQLVPYNLIFLVAFLAWVRLVGVRGPDRIWLYLGLSASAYALILVGYVYYGFYVSSHAPLLGVQGRYAFPVLIPALLVAAEFLMRPLVHLWRMVAMTLLAGFFLAGDFPVFLRNDSAAWYTSVGTVSALDPHSPLASPTE